MTAPSSTYDSFTDLSLGQVPQVDDEVLYSELLDIHNAIEALLTSSDRNSLVIPLYDLSDILNHSVQDGDFLILNLASYTIAGNIDLLTFTLVLPGGGLIFGLTVTQSSLTTKSSNPTVLTRNGGFQAAAIVGQGGLKINNTGTGPAVLAQDFDTIFFVRNLFTSAAEIGLILDGVAGFELDHWTFTSGVHDAAILRGSNPRTLLNLFNTTGNTGVAIDIQGPMTGFLSLTVPIIDSVGIGIKCDQNIVGIGVNAGIITSRAAKAIEFSGKSSAAIRVFGSRIAGNILGTAAAGAGHAFDIQGASKINSITIDDSSMVTRGAGNACFATDSDSADNITLLGDFSNTTFIPLLGATGLFNASKKDSRLKFIGCVGNTESVSDEVADSITLGCFTLDAQATTTLNFQGFNGIPTGFSDPGGGVNTTVLTASTPASGAPVALFGTTNYNGLFVAANVIVNVSFDIIRAFNGNDGAVGNWESGWVKIAGSTTDCPEIERFIGSANNEQQHTGIAKASIVYNASITGHKASAAVNKFEFSLFCDDANGEGFVKVNGSIPADLTNRDSNTNLRIPTSAVQEEKLTTFVRNRDAANDYISEALTVDIGKSG